MQVTRKMRRPYCKAQYHCSTSPLRYEEAHKPTACETVRKSNVQYGIWWDEQICQGNESIAQCDKQVNDHADGG